MNKKEKILKKIFNVIVTYSLHKRYNHMVYSYNTQRGYYTINTDGMVFYSGIKRQYFTTMNKISYKYLKKFYEDITERLWEYENY